MMKEEFRYNGLEIFCNKLIFVIGLSVVLLAIVGFLGKAPMNIISTINVCLIAIVNLLYGIVFKRKNIKIAILLFVTGFAILAILVTGLILNGI